jgi:hypothetical protein
MCHCSYTEFVEHFGKGPKQSAREALSTMNAELQEVIRKNKTNLRKIFHVSAGNAAGIFALHDVTGVQAFDEDGDGSISAQELRLGVRRWRNRLFACAGYQLTVCMLYYSYAL